MVVPDPLLPLAAAGRADAGAKAAALGALRRAGLPVPDGVVVPVDARLDAALVDALRTALAHLGDPAVAVRSSALDEDGSTSSSAGQLDTHLGVRGAAAVAARVRDVRASGAAARAVAYRAARGLPGPARVGVLVQRLVDADVAGVAVVPPPGVAGEAVVEAAWGLGTSVVEGRVTPDAWRVRVGGRDDGDGDDGGRDDGGTVVARTTGDKPVRADRAGAGTVLRAVPAAQRRAPCLDDAGVRWVVRLARAAAAVLGGAQDVEWALAGGELWLLQARPLTAALPPAAGRSTAVPARPAPGDAASADARAPAPAGALAPPGPLLVGTPASRGTAAGVVRVARDVDALRDVAPGDVLVCRETDPAWTPALAVVAAVVTEVGGVLSHAAIVARELGVPAVVAVPGATSSLRTGERVVVDGTAGTVARDPAQIRAGPVG